MGNEKLEVTYRIQDLQTGAIKVLKYQTKSKAVRVSRRMNKREQQHRFEVIRELDETNRS
jgi:hypothetical protein